MTVTATEISAATRNRSGRPRGLVVFLATVLALALLALGAGVAVLTGAGGSDRPADDSVETGFVRDMAAHHSQAVQMAQIARERSTDPAVQTFAFDIETGQLFQIGQMRGWLQSWRLSEQTDRPPMAWMPGHVGMTPGDRMPGMATTAELDRLKSLSGRALDVLFLQLMIRHHQGGLPMARGAADRAAIGYVRDMAAKIVVSQESDIVALEQLLRERGGTPLPPS